MWIRINVATQERLLRWMVENELVSAPWDDILSKLLDTAGG